MRTNIEYNEHLMEEVIRLAKLKKKKEAIGKAIERYTRYLKQQELLDLFGKVEWEGDLHEWRTSKFL
jgi:Arc/MetJ family transcription regulator